MAVPYEVHITQAPQRSGKYSVPDGAVCGNGDLGVILGSYSGGARLYLSKCDIWEGVEQAERGGIKPLGMIDIPVPPELYAEYDVVQDMSSGMLRCRFAKGERCCSFTVTVHKTENSICIESTGNIPAEPALLVFENAAEGTAQVWEQEGISGIARHFCGEDHLYETHAFAGGVQADESRYYYFAATNHDCSDPLELVIQKLTGIDPAGLDALMENHLAAWGDFWGRSSFCCSDPLLETAWIGSQYFLAICAGNPKFPPGLYGNFITVEKPSWHGDYHLNYNFQAPFYAACSSNHPELTDCYMAPLEEFMPKGRDFAERFGCAGVLYPVGIAPKGLCSELDDKCRYSFERLFLGQKNNQLHPADIPVFRWRATRDTEYARNHAYPYLKACLEFFEQYGTREPDGSFSVCKDSAHEVPIYREDFTPKKYKKVLNDKNNVLTLGLLRMGFEAGIDMATVLGIDPDKVELWGNMLKALSPFPTCLRLGKRVFRYTQSGQRWNGNGDVGLQHVYPCGCIGLSSPERELRIARNTFRQKRRCFTDDNAVSSYYPMAARLGESPRWILKNLRNLLLEFRLPNLLFTLDGGGLEYCSIAASTLNEMALQSHQGALRIFPCWDTGMDCSFTSLRGDGAFLVSSSVQGGRFGETTIFAEKGGHLSVILPYEDAAVITSSGEQKINGNRVELQTEPGDNIIINPLK